MKSPVLYPLLGAWLLSTAMAVAPEDNYVRAFIYPGVMQNGPSVTEFTSKKHGLDSPKVSLINSTTYNLWSFGSYQPGTNATTVISFFMANATAFPFMEGQRTVLRATISGTYPDGKPYGASMNADDAVIVTRGDGSSGQFDGTGFSWTGSPDMKDYSVKINAPGIKGSVKLKSIAPPRCPCGPCNAGQNMEILPNVGSVSAVPDANATVDLTINGIPLKYEGNGWSDEMWGNQPFADKVRSTVWGTARVEGFSFVWFSLLSPSGKRTSSSYAAYDGQIIEASCDSLKIIETEDNPSGYRVQMPLKSGGEFEADVIPTLFTLNHENKYVRGLAVVKGTLRGEAVTGNAIIDAFSL